MEPQTRANQLLPQIATLIGIDLGACIIEVVLFDEGAELRIPIVVCACDDLPREVRMTSSSAGVKAAAGSADVDTRGFRILNAHTPAPTYGWNLDSLVMTSAVRPI